ncbi:MAG: CAP domain-containing protein [Spirochaetaceae bacterium]|nr:MAG: CAP domain-containing protein [Spirochaetaceae bacterium]
MNKEKIRFRFIGTRVSVLAGLMLLPLAACADVTGTVFPPDLASLLDAGPEAATLTSEEQLLYDLIMEYRREHDLPEIPLSRSLTFVAQVHARDTAYNEFPPHCNGHSWSDNGPWQGGCYTADHANAPLMWEKPQELTPYPGSGFEISCSSYSIDATANRCLAAWQTSPGHDQVIRNAGPWSQMDWNAIGIGMYGTEAHVWFGSETDPLSVPAQ